MGGHSPDRHRVLPEEAEGMERDITRSILTNSRAAEIRGEEALRSAGLDAAMARKLAIGGKKVVEILSDEPATRDLMGIAPLVRAVAEIALSETTDTPLSIGIH